MKKLIVLVLAALLINVTTISSFASVAPAATEVKAGETVSVVFSFEKIGGIRGTFSVTGDKIVDKIDIQVGQDFAGSYKDGVIAYFAGKPTDFVCTVNVTLLPSAVAGQQCTISFEYESTVDGKLPATPSYKYDNAIIKIGVNYDELNAQIAIAEKLNKDDYTEDSWKALEAALKDAIEAKKATTQKAVDDAAKALKDAIDALKTKPGVVVNYDELNRQISIAEKLNKDDYTEDSWKALDKALKDAIEARKATAQPAVDAAAKALEDAIAALEKKPVVNYDELNAQIAIAEKLNKDDYTEDSWKALEEALEDAIEAKKATTQKAVDDATKALKDAIDALKTKPGVVVNYDELNKQIEIAEKLNKDDYTEDSWKALEEALEDAIEARKLTAQPAVDAAAKALEDAIAALETKPVVTPVDYTELNDQIDIAEGLEKDKYTPESWAKVETALAKAIEARKSNSQADVDAATKELKAAIDALETKTVDAPDAGDVLVILPLIMLAAALVVFLVFLSKRKAENR